MLTGLLHPEALKARRQEWLNSLRNDSQETGGLPILAIVLIALSWSLCFILFFNKLFTNAGMLLLLSFPPNKKSSQGGLEFSSVTVREFETDLIHNTIREDEYREKPEISQIKSRNKIENFAANIEYN